MIMVHHEDRSGKSLGIELRKDIKIAGDFTRCDDVYLIREIYHLWNLSQYYRLISRCGSPHFTTLDDNGILQAIYEPIKLTTIVMLHVVSETMLFRDSWKLINGEKFVAR